MRSPILRSQMNADGHASSRPLDAATLVSERIMRFEMFSNAPVKIFQLPASSPMKWPTKRPAHGRRSLVGKTIDIARIEDSDKNSPPAMDTTLVSFAGRRG
jgi:hypothetical protein